MKQVNWHSKKNKKNSVTDAKHSKPDTTTVEMQSLRANSFRSADLAQCSPSTGNESLATVFFLAAVCILNIKHAKLTFCLVEQSLLNTNVRTVYSASSSIMYPCG